MQFLLVCCGVFVLCLAFFLLAAGRALWSYAVAEGLKSGKIADEIRARIAAAEKK